MISLTARPRLSFKARLRYDRRTGRYLLLYPEAGLELSKTATEITWLCTGEWTVNDMVRRITESYVEVSSVEVERDVQRFLQALADRALLEGLQ
jgi:coenzyme PQQ biosynthesis protein PqqD